MAKVGIIMGSKSDYPVMKEAEDILKEFKVDYEINIVSAHRTPEKMMDYSKNAHERGINVNSWCRWSCSSSWDGRFNHTTSCDWSSSKV